MKPISPHAKTILALINNAMVLSCVHNEYRLSSDVVRAIKKIWKSLGFYIDNHIFDYIIDGIVSKNPIAKLCHPTIYKTSPATEK